MSLQVTELSEIYKLDGATINKIHAIYLAKRTGIGNIKGKRWSPSASCLIASMMTGVPEHFVQQIIVHFLKNGHDEMCFTYLMRMITIINCATTKSGLKWSHIFES